MKSARLGRRGQVVQALGIAVLAGVLAGCHSVGFKTGDGTASSFQKASRQIRAESRALDATIAALDDLISKPATDLKPQFILYTERLDDLADSVVRTDQAIARIRSESNEYFQAWDQELTTMNYGLVRDHSEARRSEVSNQVETVCQRYESTQDVVRPLIRYFSDIKKFVGTDLTLDGIAAAKEIVRNAGENTRKVQTGLAQLTAELTVSGDRLSSVTRAKRPAPEASTATPPTQIEAGLR